VVGFTAYAGEACDPMNCLLARYPEQVLVGQHLVSPGIKGWRGSSFAKTQYASTVAAQHFLKCHLTITAALDAAKALDLPESVSDEGGYWDDRDLQKRNGEFRTIPHHFKIWVSEEKSIFTISNNYP